MCAVEQKHDIYIKASCCYKLTAVNTGLVL